MNATPLPDFVGQAQAAAGPLALALIVAVVWLVIENWPETPKKGRF